MTEINWPLLDEALDYIEAHPEEWDQTYYHTFADDKAYSAVPSLECGSTFCLAGTVCRLSTGISFQCVAYPFGEYAVVPNDPDGRPTSAKFWKSIALGQLGLTYQQADVIFAASAPIHLGATHKDWEDPQKFRQFVYEYLKSTS